jgi:iron complex outermembrane receptor protein
MKVRLLQGAAVAALSFAFVLPAGAAEEVKVPGAAPVIDQLKDKSKDASADSKDDGDRKIMLAQASVSEPVGAVAAATVAEQVVVSAFKRETLLQNTPVAISVASPADLENRHVQSLIDLSNGLPSLRVATFEARQSALTVGIRGIVPFDANQTARDQGVGIYLDGLYLGRQQGLSAALLDVERIEVLRGPQGTLFGRNTEGGAVSIVTKAPSGVFGGKVDVGLGNFGEYHGGLHLDLPEYANIAFKLDAVLQHQDETVTNPLSGQYGWNYFNRYGARLAARWTPVEHFTADFAFDTGVDQNTPFYSQLVNYNPLKRVVGVYDPVTSRLVAPGSAPGAATCAACIAPLSPLVQVHSDRQKAAEIGVPQQLSVDKTHGAMATLNYEVVPELTLRSITGWRSVTTDQWDNSGGAHRTIFAPNTNFSRYSLSRLRQHQFSEEVQAFGSIPQFDYVFGLYYFHENATEEAATPSTNRWNATGTGYTINSENAIPPITSANQGWDSPAWFVQRGSKAKAESFSVFGSVTYTPAGFDILHLTGGGRYSQDKRDGVLYTVQGKATNFGFTFDNGRFDPMVTLALDATPNVHLYATYATGFRAGGANDRSQTFAAFGPEEVDSYEIGAKTDLFDNRVRLNVAAYMMDRTGTQTDFDNVDTNPASPTFNLHTEETRNAPGVSKIRGVEVELTANLTDELRAGVSYAYTDAQVPLTPNPFLGNALTPVFVVFTPKNAISGSLDYEMPIGGGDMTALVHFDANYASRTYSFQAESVKTDPSFVVNGRIGLGNIAMGSGQSLTLSAWARNLLDETHIYRRSNANGSILGDYANFNPPRTVGLEAKLGF